MVLIEYHNHTCSLSNMYPYIILAFASIVISLAVLAFVCGMRAFCLVTYVLCCARDCSLLEFDEDSTIETWDPDMQFVNVDVELATPS